MRISALVALLALAPLRASMAAGFGPNEIGTSGAPFLKLGADARAAGMGGAVRAAVDDATAIYWNPAGLAGLRYRHLTMTHGAAYQSTFQDFIAYAQPVSSPFGSGKSGRERDLRPDNFGALGVAVLYQNAGSIATVDNTGSKTGENITPQDVAILIAWGVTVARGLDVGAGVKYVSSKIAGSASTGAVDIGARWRTWLPGEFPYAISFSAQNIGGQLRFHETSDPLPLHVTIGQALRIFKGLVATFDWNVPRDRSPYANLGVEARIPMQQGLSAALRTGYEGRLGRSDSGGSIIGVTFGGGLIVQRWGFDYGWTPAGGLGSTHKLSLSYRF